MAINSVEEIGTLEEGKDYMLLAKYSKIGTTVGYGMLLDKVGKKREYFEYVKMYGEPEIVTKDTISNINKRKSILENGMVLHTTGLEQYALKVIDMALNRKKQMVMGTIEEGMDYTLLATFSRVGVAVGYGKINNELKKEREYFEYVKMQGEPQIVSYGTRDKIQKRMAELENIMVMNKRGLEQYALKVIDQAVSRKPGYER